MIPKAITAPFRWWAKHPWIVLWGAILLYLVFIVIALGSLYRPSVFEGRIIALLLAIVWILSFSRGVFVTWQRSKDRAVLAVVASAITILMGIGIFLTMEHHARGLRHSYDSDVKYNLKNAYTAQEAYFVDHETYTSNIGSLTRFNQSSNVTISVEATAITFVITGTIKKGCKENTGTWSLNSTTGVFVGTPCSLSRWP